MPPAAQYRKLAAELRARARGEKNASMRTEWGHLAQCYVRLAVQAEKNQLNDISYESIGGLGGPRVLRETIYRPNNS
jgi:hypothetical protein